MIHVINLHKILSLHISHLAQLIPNDLNNMCSGVG